MSRRPRPPPSSGGKGKKPNTDVASELGLAVRPLDAREKQQVETDGVLVVEQVSGPALAAGVQQGDIILAVNGKKVKTIADLTRCCQGGWQDRGAADSARRRRVLRAAAVELSSWELKRGRSPLRLQKALNRRAAKTQSTAAAAGPQPPGD